MSYGYDQVQFSEPEPYSLTKNLFSPKMPYTAPNTYLDKVPVETPTTPGIPNPPIIRAPAPVSTTKESFGNLPDISIEVILIFAFILIVLVLFAKISSLEARVQMLTMANLHHTKAV